MRIIWWIGIASSLGCAGHLRIDVMEPAEIKVKQDVTTLALVDRQPSRHSFKALYALREAVADAPRFKVVSNESAQAALNGAAPTSGKPLTKSNARSICRATGASGIASVERFVVHDEWVYSEREEEVTETQTVTLKNGDQEDVEVTRDVTIHEARFSLNVDSSWTLYDCDGEVLDTHAVALGQTWTGEAESKADARLDVGEPKKLRATMMGSAGRVYRNHISPWARQVDRKYFRGGSSQVRAGRKLAEANAWDKAYKEWKKGAKVDRNKAAAKAWHNLAVYHEQKGNLKLALRYAKRASKVLGRGWVDDYPDLLEERIANKIRLGEQLGLEEEED
jgi:hypothetical protein